MQEIHTEDVLPLSLQDEERRIGEIKGALC